MGCCCTVAREAVSKKKRRLRIADGEPGSPPGGVNLDMTLVHPHIICMGYPSEGFEAWYRNPYEHVLSYLDHRYPERYLVYNFCVEDQHQYDPASHFHGAVNNEFRFQDMTPCPLEMIPRFVDTALRFLSRTSTTAEEPIRSSASKETSGQSDGQGSTDDEEKGPGAERATNVGFGTHKPPRLKEWLAIKERTSKRNFGSANSGAEMMKPVDSVSSLAAPGDEKVVALHCKAGKGRTGLMACCLLLALEPSLTPDEVLSYYGEARTHNGQGLSHRSQRRYVEYYHRLCLQFNGHLPADPSRIPVVHLKKIRLNKLLFHLGTRMKYIRIISPTTNHSLVISLPVYNFSRSRRRRHGLRQQNRITMREPIEEAAEQTTGEEVEQEEEEEREVVQFDERNGSVTFDLEALEMGDVRCTSPKYSSPTGLTEEAEGTNTSSGHGVGTRRLAAAGEGGKRTVVLRPFDSAVPCSPPSGHCSCCVAGSPASDSSSSSSTTRPPKHKLKEVRDFFRSLRGDVRIEFSQTVEGGTNWLGALVFHTLFIQHEYHYMELDTMYKAHTLPRDAGLSLEYDLVNNANPIHLADPVSPRATMAC